MNATVEEINKNFKALLFSRAPHRVVFANAKGLSESRAVNKVKSARRRMRNGGVSIETKIDWLVRAGWRPEGETMYSKKEILTIIRSVKKMSKEKRAMPAEFILEQIKL